MTDHGVEGCEIVVPKFSWSETWQLPIAMYNWAYSQTLKAITGKVNAAAFRGFPAGQVLFRGGKGSRPYHHVKNFCCQDENLWCGDRVFQLLNDS